MSNSVSSSEATTACAALRRPGRGAVKRQNKPGKLLPMFPVQTVTYDPGRTIGARAPSNRRAYSPPQIRLRRINGRAFVGEAGSAVLIEQQRSVEIDPVRPLRHQERRRHAERGSDHAPNHDLEAHSFGGALQGEGLAQPSSFVQFNVDRVVGSGETREIVAGMTRLIRTDRHRTIERSE